MAFFNGVGANLGNPTVVAEQDRGHSIEFYADQAVKRILGSATSKDPALQAQVRAFQGELKTVLIQTIQRAIRSDRLTLAGDLKKCGYTNIAEQIRSRHLGIK